MSIASLPSNQNCVLNNASGVVATSDVVSVAVSCTTRSWTAGQQLDGDDVNVRLVAGGIDRSGRMTAVYVKNTGGVGGTSALYATRGTPGAKTDVPVWTAPVRIDTAQTAFFVSYLHTSQSLSVAVSPAGNVHAAWVSQAPCTSTTYSVSGSCAYIYSATLSANSNTWSAPVLVGDTPDGSFSNGPGTGTVIAYINDRGDAVVKYGGYDFGSPPVRTYSASAYRATLALRPAGQTTFQTSLLRDYQYADDVQVVLDKNGVVVAAAERVQPNSSNRDITAYVGSASGGITSASATVVDQIASTAIIDRLHVGSTGDVLLTWKQNDGSGAKVFAAMKPAASSAWTTPAVVTSSTSFAVSTVTDAGDAVYYNACNRYFFDRSTNAWSVKLPVQPRNCSLPDRDSEMASDGSYLDLRTNGVWTTYNQSDNTMSRLPDASLTGNDYLLGFAGLGNLSIPLFTRTQDGNYIGGYLHIYEYDVLPTPTATSGIGRRGIANLWGFFLK